MASLTCGMLSQNMIFKHFAFTIYSGLPLKLSNSFVSQDWKMEPLCFVQWNLFDFQFNLQIANAATKRLSVPAYAWSNLSFALFLSIETGPC